MWEPVPVSALMHEVTCLGVAVLGVAVLGTAVLQPTHRTVNTASVPICHMRSTDTMETLEPRA